MRILATLARMKIPHVKTVDEGGAGTKSVSKRAAASKESEIRLLLLADYRYLCYLCVGARSRHGEGEREIDRGRSRE